MQSTCHHMVDQFPVNQTLSAITGAQTCSLLLETWRFKLEVARLTLTSKNACDGSVYNLTYTSMNSSFVYPS